MQTPTDLLSAVELAMVVLYVWHVATQLLALAISLLRPLAVLVVAAAFLHSEKSAWLLCDVLASRLVHAKNWAMSVSVSARRSGDVALPASRGRSPSAGREPAPADT
ncbi:uncharacterized protein LOC134534426 [Bacillus rossius redtenbacheri]|uniref:uncharacterized protein LOC134534426 n=1 Tax=Bacillus rossius redtenbacheri TaxID=93214 RepID=UPI002FDCBB6D